MQRSGSGRTCHETVLKPTLQTQLPSSPSFWQLWQQTEGLFKRPPTSWLLPPSNTCCAFENHGSTMDEFAKSERTVFRKFVRVQNRHSLLTCSVARFLRNHIVEQTVSVFLSILERCVDILKVDPQMELETDGGRSRSIKCGGPGHSERAHVIAKVCGGGIF